MKDINQQNYHVMCRLFEIKQVRYSTTDGITMASNGIKKQDIPVNCRLIQMPINLFDHRKTSYELEI